MASKYADVIGSLAPAPPEDAGYQGKVDQYKLDVKSNSVDASAEIAKVRLLEQMLIESSSSIGGTHVPQSLVRAYIMVRKEHEEAKALLSMLQLRLTAFEQMVAESQDTEEAGWGEYGATPNTLKLVDGTSVRVDTEPQGKVVDKEAFRLWCLANGLEKSLQMWPSTMNAMAKEMLLNGQAPPTGVEVFLRKKLVLKESK